VCVPAPPPPPWTAHTRSPPSFSLGVFDSHSGPSHPRQSPPSVLGHCCSASCFFAPSYLLSQDQLLAPPDGELLRRPFPGAQIVVPRSTLVFRGTTPPPPPYSRSTPLGFLLPKHSPRPGSSFWPQDPPHCFATHSRARAIPHPRSLGR